MFKEGRKKKNEKTQREQTENKKGSVDLSPIISIITINRKGINTSIKGQRLEEWIRTSMTQFYAFNKKITSYNHHIQWYRYIVSKGIENKTNHTIVHRSFIDNS